MSETAAFPGLLLPYTDAAQGFGIWEAKEAAAFLVVGILDEPVHVTSMDLVPRFCWLQVL